jgi:hypothetical protein
MHSNIYGTVDARKKENSDEENPKVVMADGFTLFCGSAGGFTALRTG